MTSEHLKNAFGVGKHTAPSAALLLGLVLSSVLPACGRSTFGGNIQPTPTPPPMEPAPPAPVSASDGSDASIITTVGGLDTADRPGNPTGPISIVVATTPAPIPIAVTSVTLPPIVSVPSQPPLSSLTGTPIPPLGPGELATGGAVACTATQMRIGSHCVPALPLHKWSKGNVHIVSVMVTDACVQDADAACHGLRLRGLGFQYTGVDGYVFPESALQAVATAGMSPVRVLVCHKLRFGDERSDALLANPTAAQLSNLQTQCPSGTEGFLVASATASRFKALVSLESNTTVGYFPSP